MQTIATMMSREAGTLTANYGAYTSPRLSEDMKESHTKVQSVKTLKRIIFFLNHRTFFFFVCVNHDCFNRLKVFGIHLSRIRLSFSRKWKIFY